MNHINQVLCRNRIADNKIGIKQIYKWVGVSIGKIYLLYILCISYMYT